MMHVKVLAWTVFARLGADFATVKRVLRVLESSRSFCPTSKIFVPWRAFLSKVYVSVIGLKPL